ncbi:uncharacterized protein PV07_12793 [Cladophialophora immunda]|uniref:Uncharacterized protein n=1 Tax=Cladophialophora immunda TaxID=569365 RepID=A0A0D2BRT2_9EURO|nr:uncharacterized protein PV07_12793 [Cladophialophora immunda]KIW21778.1 hypothetical protein PV07_12793 [Cladophialophora immunda]
MSDNRSPTSWFEAAIGDTVRHIPPYVENRSSDDRPLSRKSVVLYGRTSRGWTLNGGKMVMETTTATKSSGNEDTREGTMQQFLLRGVISTAGNSAGAVCDCSSQ